MEWIELLVAAGLKPMHSDSLIVLADKPEAEEACTASPVSVSLSHA